MRKHAKWLFAVSVMLISLGAAEAVADTAPSATVDAPSSVSYTSAHLSGTVDPNGGPSDANWHFEYSTDDSSWSQAGEGGSAGSGSGPVNVSAELTGLSPGTEYYVRLVASNDGGETASAGPDPSFTTLSYPQPEATIDPVDLSGLSVHLSGTVDPNGIETDYRFELAVDDGAPDWKPLGTGSSESGSPIAVEAEKAELTAQTDYLARLVATSEGGTATSTEESFSTGTAAPTVHVLPGSGRTTAGVRLNATINPNGLPTEYRFEWGSTASYGNLVPSAGGDAYGGQGTSTSRYSKPISGLTPNTTIHYRVVAHNEEGTTVSPDQTVVTLAEEVFYEMVSPPNKEGSNLYFCCTARVSADGVRATYMSAGVFSGGSSNLQLNTYLSSRGADNWSTQFLPLPQTTKNGGFTNGGTQGFSPELTKVFLFSREALLPGAIAGRSNMYQRDLQTGELSFVTTFEDSSYGMLLGDARILQGTTPDGDHMVFRSPEKLTPEAIEGNPNGPGNFYDYSEGEMHLLSVLPNGEAAGAEAISVHTDHLGGNPLSEDGSRFFFLAGGQLYLREGDTTVQVSASQRSVPVGVTFVNLGARASQDGSVVYFLATGSEGMQGLTDDAPPYFGEGEGQLYRYDAETGELAYVPFGDDGPMDTNFAEYILGISADGSTVYFTGGHSDGTSTSIYSPSNRLYVSRNGESHYIGSTDLAAHPFLDDGSVSPNGRYLAITSSDATLTTPAANSCAGCTQIYVYDDEHRSEGFRCASCNPDGDVTSATNLRVEGNENAGDNLNRMLLDNGDVFFENEDRLVPEDTNDKIDVYRWNAGQLDLISRGFGKENSFVADVTPDGRSVFFYTGEHLVTQDVDDAQDLYVARVGGGLSSQNPPPPEGPCFGEGCLNRSPDTPPDVTPGSNGFQGPANPKPSFPHRKRCGKGKKRKVVAGKAKCVKRKATHSRGGHK